MTLLIVDDSLSGQVALRAILGSIGYADVVAAGSAEEGIEFLRSRTHTSPVDLVLMDLMMPGMDGFGLLQAMKADDALKDIPVIVVSAKELTPHERKRLAGQVQALLQKGAFTDQELLADIQAALE